MPVVSRASLTIQANTDAEVDEVYRVLLGLRDEQTEVYVSVNEASRELES